MGRFSSLLAAGAAGLALLASGPSAVAAASGACSFNGLDMSALSKSEITFISCNYQYDVRVCGTLAAGCTPDDLYAAVCQTGTAGPTGSQNYTIADAPASGTYNWAWVDPSKEALGFGYQLVGQKQCWGGSMLQNYITNVNFLCADPATTVHSAVTSVCLTTITIPTLDACTTPPSPPCSFAGRDFSSLSAQDYVFTPPSNKHTYALRVCGLLAQGCAGSEGSAVCQTANPAGSPAQNYDIADAPATGVYNWAYIEPSNPDAGVGYQLTGANECWSSTSRKPYITNVNFVCAEATTPTAVNNGCLTTITFPTPLACKNSTHAHRHSKSGGRRHRAISKLLTELF